MEHKKKRGLPSFNSWEEIKRLTKPTNTKRKTSASAEHGWKHLEDPLGEVFPKVATLGNYTIPKLTTLVKNTIPKEKSSVRQIIYEGGPVRFHRSVNGVDNVVRQEKMQVPVQPRPCPTAHLKNASPTKPSRPRPAGCLKKLSPPTPTPPPPRTAVYLKKLSPPKPSRQRGAVCLKNASPPTPTPPPPRAAVYLYKELSPPKPSRQRRAVCLKNASPPTPTPPPPRTAVYLNKELSSPKPSRQRRAVCLKNAFPPTPTLPPPRTAVYLKKLSPPTQPRRAVCLNNASPSTRSRPPVYLKNPYTVTVSLTRIDYPAKPVIIPIVTTASVPPAVVYEEDSMSSEVLERVDPGFDDLLNSFINRYVIGDEIPDISTNIEWDSDMEIDDVETSLEYLTRTNASDVNEDVCSNNENIIEGQTVQKNDGNIASSIFCDSHYTTPNWGVAPDLDILELMVDPDDMLDMP